MDPGVQRALASRISAAHRRKRLICQKRYFAAYEVTKKALTPANASSSDLNIGRVILAGGTAGVAMWAIAIPPDVCSPTTYANFQYPRADFVLH